MKGGLPFPLFNAGNKETSTKHFATLFGGEGVDYRGKRCFHSKEKYYCQFESVSFAKN